MLITDMSMEILLIRKPPPSVKKEKVRVLTASSSLYWGEKEPP